MYKGKEGDKNRERIDAEKKEQADKVDKLVEQAKQLKEQAQKFQAQQKQQVEASKLESAEMKARETKGVKPTGFAPAAKEQSSPSQQSKVSHSPQEPAPKSQTKLEKLEDDVSKLTTQLQARLQAVKGLKSMPEDLRTLQSEIRTKQGQINTLKQTSLQQRGAELNIKTLNAKDDANLFHAPDKRAPEVSVNDTIKQLSEAVTTYLKAEIDLNIDPATTPSLNKAITAITALSTPARIPTPPPKQKSSWSDVSDVSNVDIGFFNKTPKATAKSEQVANYIDSVCRILDSNIANSPSLQQAGMYLKKLLEDVKPKLESKETPGLGNR